MPLWYLSQPLSSILVRMKMQATHFPAPLVRSASTVSCQQWKAGSWTIIYFLESHSRVSTVGTHFRTKDIKGGFLFKWLFLNSFTFDKQNETPIHLQAAGSLLPVLCTVDLSTSLKEQCRRLRSLQVLLHGGLFPSELNCLMISQSPFCCFRFRGVKS